MGNFGENNYIAVFIAMVMTGVGVPLPGEITLAFTGYLVYSGQLEFIRAAAAATLGDFLGAAISYGIGYFGRSNIVKRYLGFIMPSEAKLSAVNKWLASYGLWALLVGRLMPVVRGALPISAGFVHMNFKEYMLGNVISASIWCSTLIYLGVALGENWQQIAEMGGGIVLAVSASLLAALLVWYALRNYSKRK